MKTLEERGIGRPSTYAQILSTIQDRGYARREQGTLFPTDSACRSPTCWCRTSPRSWTSSSPPSSRSRSTRSRRATRDWVETVAAFYKQFAKDLKRAGKKMDDVKEGVETGEACPECGKPLLEKWGRFGKFLACSAYPDCKFTKDLGGARAAAGRAHRRELPDVRQADGGQARPVRQVHRVLGLPRVQDHQAGARSASRARRTGCGGQLVERRSKRGKTFYACANYPKCTFSVWARPVRGAVPQVRGAVPHRALRPRRQAGRGACVREECGYKARAGSRASPERRVPRCGRAPIGTIRSARSSSTSAVERGASAHTLRSYARRPARVRARSCAARRSAGARGRSTRASSARIPGLAAPSAGWPRPPSRASSPRCGAASASSPAAASSSANPARRCAARGCRRRLPSFLPKDESEGPAGPAAGRSRRRARATDALLELLYASGLRVAECCGLDVDDLDRGQGTVRVLGKGGKERVVPVGEAALAALGALPRAARAAGAGPLFLNPRGGRLTTRSAHRIVSGRARAAGHRPARDAAHPPPQLRHPHAGRGRRSAADPGAARPQPALHDPALHPREPGALCACTTPRTRGRGAERGRRSAMTSPTARRSTPPPWSASGTGAAWRWRATGR